MNKQLSYALCVLFKEGLLAPYIQPMCEEPEFAMPTRFFFFDKPYTTVQKLSSLSEGGSNSTFFSLVRSNWQCFAWQREKETHFFSSLFFFFFHRKSPLSLTFPVDFSPFSCICSWWNGTPTPQQCSEFAASLWRWVWYSFMLIIYAVCVVCFACARKPDLYQYFICLAESATYMFSKLHYFVCKLSSPLRVGKMLLSLSVTSKNI